MIGKAIAHHVRGDRVGDRCTHRGRSVRANLLNCMIGQFDVIVLRDHRAQGGRLVHPRPVSPVPAPLALLPIRLPSRLAPRLHVPLPVHAYVYHGRGGASQPSGTHQPRSVHATPTDQSVVPALTTTPPRQSRSTRRRTNPRPPRGPCLRPTPPLRRARRPVPGPPRAPAHAPATGDLTAAPRTPSAPRAPQRTPPEPLRRTLRRPDRSPRPEPARRGPGVPGRRIPQ